MNTSNLQVVLKEVMENNGFYQKEAHYAQVCQCNFAIADDLWLYLKSLIEIYIFIACLHSQWVTKFS